MKTNGRSLGVRGLVLLGAVVTAPMASAAIVISSAGQSYNQNFDTLTVATTSQSWANDATLSGWSLFNGTGAAITSYVGGNGGSNAGSFYSLGAASSTDRALGGIGSGGTYFGSPASGAVAGYVAASFTNSSGLALSGFTLSFDGEQWRNGGNTSAQAMVLEYGFGSSFSAVTSWLAPGGAFDWTSPVATATAAAVNGNVAGWVAGRGGTVSTVWNAGDTLWVRWIERNDAGNDHGLAIDNFSFTAGAAPVPVPAALPLLLSGVAFIGAALRRRHS
jgi:hypothetical protein